MNDELAAACAAHHEEIIAFRRRMHAHPELSGTEHVTTEELVARLGVAGLTPRVLESGTGVVCDIVGDPSGPLVVLRADIDALAMDDRSGAPYASTTPGVAHACGHDAHTAIVLGAGLSLCNLKDALPGTVRLVFEPAEESMPGGAVEVVEAGWVDDARAVLGVHCDPKIDVGSIGLRVGPITAASDRATIDVFGPGGHTARPHLTVDMVRVLGTLAVQLPELYVERLAADGTTVLVFGAVSAGDAANVIPAHGRLAGAARTTDPIAWQRSESVLSELLTEVLAPTGAQWKLTYERGMPPVMNDVTATQYLRTAAEQVVGAAHVVDTPQSMGADSFAWYGERAPASYARLGTHTPGTPTLDLHASSFDIDERAIPIGIQFLAQSAMEALRS